MIRNDNPKAYWKDIPAFTKNGSYAIDVPWDYIEYTIVSWSKDHLVDTDPDFQRAHVWTQAQQIKYVEYIMRGGYAAREIYWNCTTCRMRWYVNDLRTREEVLKWYLDLNSGGVVHTPEELRKVREMLTKP